jgi:predicted metal-binding transcription factor (methanogenesis marker protein 9)
MSIHKVLYNGGKNYMIDDLATQLEKLAELLKRRHLSEDEYSRAKDKLFLSGGEVNNYLVPHLVRLAELYDNFGLSEEEYAEAKRQLSRRFNF